MTSTYKGVVKNRFKRYKNEELPDNRIMDAYHKALKEIVDVEFGGPNKALEKARIENDLFLRILAINTFE